MHKQIIRRPFSSAIVSELNQQLPPLLSRIYAARRVENLDEVDHTLAKLYPYQSMLNIHDAANLLADSVIRQEKILIVGDFDADGATSTAVAVRALRSLGANAVQFLVPNRFTHGYGLTPELVNDAKRDQPQLIVTVDNGIANHAGVDAAKALGIKVLLTDHHLPADTLPNADVIVNPNQRGDQFPSKNLAGVGVIFYVMLALRRELLTREWFLNKEPPNMAHLLDLVALGTVADLVPLDHNNRILVEGGMRRIRAGQCSPAILALLEIAARDFTKAKTSDLGFAVASRLNAAGRLDDMSLGITCLLTDDRLVARELASKLDLLNSERRSIETDMQTHAFTILNQISDDIDKKLPRGICLFDPTWHQGVIGILASRIKDRYHRPVVIFAKGPDGDELKGSARSIHGLHIRDTLALIHARHPKLINKFGGHAMAAGLSIAKHLLDDFSQIFNQVVTQQLTEAQLTQQIMSDGELRLDELSLEVATMLRDAGPWGQAFEEPLFDDVFTIVEQRVVGDKHLKLRLAKEKKIFDAIAFFIDTKRWPDHRVTQIRAAFRLEINEFNNKRFIQLIVEHLEPV